MHAPSCQLRLEEHLTVPTRNHPNLVDCWMSLRWEGGLAEWTKQFCTVADAHNSTIGAAGALQFVPMSEHEGWIVARGVDLKIVTPRDVEALVSRLVAQVSAQVATSATLTPDSRPAGWSWSHRIRSSMRSGGSILGGLLPATRTRGDADVVSST